MDTALDPNQQERARLRAVLEQLEGLHGRPDWHSHGPPLDTLVATILSQNTSDANSQRAFDELRRRYPRWEDVRHAPVADVADAIRSGGLATQKAPRIQAVLEQVLTDGHQDTLTELSPLPLSEAKARLTALPGVGPKTAACVLLFSCGQPALPVDTHVYRVSQRLGLIPAAMGTEEAHDYLERLLDPKDVYSFHVTMIRHGRRICVARKPACGRCPLAQRCQYHQAGGHEHRGV